jgi:hypothetical protein
VIGLEVIAETKGPDMFIDKCRDILGATLGRASLCSAAIATYRKIEVDCGHGDDGSGQRRLGCRPPP